jgi:hypothetical protein
MREHTHTQQIHRVDQAGSDINTDTKYCTNRNAWKYEKMKGTDKQKENNVKTKEREGWEERKRKKRTKKQKT